AGAADLAGEADAAAAHYAAIDEQRHRIAQAAAAAGERLNVGPPFLLAVFEVKILQVALARLVADRTIDGVPQKQIFLDHRPRVFHLLAVGHEHGAVGRRSLAGGHMPRPHCDFAGFFVLLSRFDEAHAAAGDNREAWMPAI